MLGGCHFDEFTNEIGKSKNIHFLAISETWLRNKINTNKSVEIPGYKILRSDRLFSKFDKNKGGGVALYVKIGIQSKILSKSSDECCTFKNIDFIFVECKTINGVIAICVIYRRNICTTSETNEFFEFLTEFSANYVDIIIIGDFNLNILYNT